MSKSCTRNVWLCSLLTLGLVALTAAAVAEPTKLRTALTNHHQPEVDQSAFYMFRSYEPGREGYVTLIANYNPLQMPGGAPHFYPLDERARYDVHIDNDGDGLEDLTFRFRVVNRSPFLGTNVPLQNPQTFTEVGIANVFPAGPGSPPPDPNAGIPPNNQRVNWNRAYTVRVIQGSADQPPQGENFLTYADNPAAPNQRQFWMPFDYIGPRSFPNYDAYAQRFIYDVDIPGCGDGRVFVGQRQESFAFNRGKYFDLVGITNRVGARDADPNPLADFNVTSLALEVPIDCLTGGGDGVIGGWTTGRRTIGSDFLTGDDPTFEETEELFGSPVQVSRFGMPFVNSPQIGLPDQNRYNTTHPVEDFDLYGRYFQFPSIPQGIELVSILDTTLGLPQPFLAAPSNIPRQDMVAFFLTGLPGLNQTGSNCEVVRLDTTVPPTPAAQQNNLGFLEGDNAGFPNGRRPGDDVIDIIWRILEGRLCHPPYDTDFGFCEPADAPSGLEPTTDQVWVDATEFQEAFPYLNTPLPGAGH